MESLFVYGTLRPGEANAHWLTALAGTWEPATLQGRLFADGLPITEGYPVIWPAENGREIPGWLFHSPDLFHHWADLDAFEGEAYLRVQIEVKRPSGTRVSAHVYALNGFNFRLVIQRNARHDIE